MVVKRKNANGEVKEYIYSDSRKKIPYEERNYNWKLNKDQQKEIISRVNNKEYSYRELAKIYNVSRQLICKIMKRYNKQFA
jgi:DNA invertase Pin-like site-specific DNA recombinase